MGKCISKHETFIDIKKRVLSDIQRATASHFPGIINYSLIGQHFQQNYNVHLDSSDDAIPINEKTMESVRVLADFEVIKAHLLKIIELRSELHSNYCVPDVSGICDFMKKYEITTIGENDDEITKNLGSIASLYVAYIMRFMYWFEKI